MGFEDRRILLAQLPGNGIPIPCDFLTRRVHRALQPLQFVFDRIARNEPPRDAKSLVVHHQRFADGDPGRNGDTLKLLHVGVYRFSSRFVVERGL